MRVSKEELYKELGEFQRFTLRWREGLFQGFLLVLGALTVALYSVWASTSSELKRLLWVIPLAGGFLGIIFSLIDRRCHEILRRNYDLGAQFEEVVGIYRASKRNPERISHTAVLQTLYIGSASALFILFVVLLFGTAGKDTNMVPQTRPTISDRFSQVWTTERLDDQALRIIEKASRGEALTKDERGILDLWLKQMKSNLPDDRSKQKPTEKAK